MERIPDYRIRSEKVRSDFLIQRPGVEVRAGLEDREAGIVRRVRRMERRDLDDWEREDIWQMTSHQRSHLRIEQWHKQRENGGRRMEV